MEKKEQNFPEPVPAASQLAILPFLSAVHGYFLSTADDARKRVTMHRVMSRDGEGYLQQICTYLGPEQYSQETAGRMFTVDTGIMGHAFCTSKIQRTKFYPTEDLLRTDLKQDMIDTGKSSRAEDEVLSFLAIPFLGPDDTAVLVLYAECDILNFFVNEERISLLVKMCQGFCDLLDWLNTEHPFNTLRNFPLDVRNFQYDTPTVFPRLQESAPVAPPQFKRTTSFNFDASVS